MSNAVPSSFNVATVWGAEDLRKGLGFALDLVKNVGLVKNAFSFCFSPERVNTEGDFCVSAIRYDLSLNKCSKQKHSPPPGKIQKPYISRSGCFCLGHWLSTDELWRVTLTRKSLKMTSGIYSSVVSGDNGEG